jgi:hypothetical protein
MSKYLDELEKESINLIREVITTTSLNDICCFYSMGKDSSVLLKLMEKAFYPEKIKIPFLHIDTGWKFKEMYEFRDKISKQIDLKIYKHPALLNPYTDGSEYVAANIKSNSYYKVTYNGEEFIAPTYTDSLNYFGYVFCGSDDESEIKEYPFFIANANGDVSYTRGESLPFTI